ncbi:LPXTG cell wall anchor domain-containing protein, partial [Gemella haemolysans]
QPLKPVDPNDPTKGYEVPDVPGDPTKDTPINYVPKDPRPYPGPNPTPVPNPAPAPKPEPKQEPKDVVTIQKPNKLANTGEETNGFGALGLISLVAAEIARRKKQN